MNFFPFITYVVVTTFTPGPNNMMATTNGLQVGFRRSLGFLLGVFTGFFLVMLICGSLNFVILSLLPKIRVWLNILGALYMLYLAIHILLSKPPQEDPAGRRLNTFKAGFAMQFLNLKGILYGITVFSIFIIPFYQGFANIVLFSMALAVIGFVAISCWAFFGVVFRKFFFKYNRVINFVMAALLIYTAIESLEF